MSGAQSSTHLLWTVDSQDSAIVPSRGVHAIGQITHYIDWPSPTTETTRSTKGVTQAFIAGSWFKPLDRNAKHRIFTTGGAGTSFGDHPLPTEQFALGGPFKMSALDTNAKRGDQFIQISAGYLKQVTRLPDFLGGQLLIGGWLEEGSAFDRLDKAQWDTNFSTGLIADTLIGPIFVGFSVGVDGSTRTYLAIGKLFR